MIRYIFYLKVYLFYKLARYGGLSETKKERANMKFSVVQGKNNAYPNVNKVQNRSICE